jgi:hypothetical protein
MPTMSIDRGTVTNDSKRLLTACAQCPYTVLYVSWEQIQFDKSVDERATHERECQSIL